MTSVSNQLFRGSGFLELDPGVHQLALPELPECQTKRNVNVLLFAISSHSVHVLPFAQKYLLFHQLALQTNHCLTEYTKASISEEIRH